MKKKHIVYTRLRDHLKKHDNKLLYHLLVILGHVKRPKRIRYYSLVSLMIVVGVLESVSTAWMALYASLLANPNNIVENDVVAKVLSFARIEIGGDVQQLLVSGAIIMALLILVKNSVRAFQRYFAAYFSSDIGAWFGERILSRVINRSYRWYLTKKPSEIHQTIEWRNFVSDFLLNIQQALSDIIIVLFLFATLLISNAFIAGPIVAGLTVMAIATYSIIRKQIDRVSVNLKKYQMKAFGELRTILGGYKNIRISGVEDVFSNRFHRPLISLIRYNAGRAFWVGAPMLILETLGFIALAVAIASMLLVADSTPDETLGLLALMAVTAWRVLPALNRFLSTQSNIRANYPFLEAFFDLMSEKDTFAVSSSASRAFKATDSKSLTAFDHVSFSYDADTAVIQDMQFEIQPCDKVAILGVSGSGKTTMVDILTGLLIPQTGIVHLDCDGPPDAILTEWKSKIAYLPQKVQLVEGTIWENVAFGVEPSEIDKERVIRACELAEISDVFFHVQTSDDRIIGEDGMTLSGGQVQRIGIARMFYRDSPIWIIDEGTASLDINTEKMILDNIFREGREKTILFITHRTETISYCDKVMIIKDGRITYFDQAENIVNDLDESLLTTKDEDYGQR